MSSNVITVYGIVGASGHFLLKSFSAWNKKTLTLEQKRLAGTEFEKTFSRLSRHATEPPIVFYRSYADAWSAPGALLEAAIVAQRRRFKEVQFDTWAVCFRTTDLADELPRLRGIARKLRGREFKELRWFCAALMDCHDAMDWLGGGYVFIHFKPIGLSVDDPQIIDSLDQIPSWLLPPKPRQS